jgi:hypothetical protein
MFTKETIRIETPSYWEMPKKLLNRKNQFEVKHQQIQKLSTAEAPNSNNKGMEYQIIQVFNLKLPKNQIFNNIFSRQFIKRSIFSQKVNAYFLI